MDATSSSLSGMTLVELVVSMLILGLVSAGLLSLGISAIRLNYSAAQHSTAFSRCLDLYEHIRGMTYEDANQTNFPTEVIRLTHLGGSQRVPLMARRTVTITELPNPTRKEVEVVVSWTSGGRRLSSKLTGTVYKKL